MISEKAKMYISQEKEAQEKILYIEEENVPHWTCIGALTLRIVTIGAQIQGRNGVP